MFLTDLTARAAALFRSDQAMSTTDPKVRIRALQNIFITADPAQQGESKQCFLHCQVSIVEMCHSLRL